MATMVTEPDGVERRATAGRWVLRGVGVLAVWTGWTFLVGLALLASGNGGTTASTVVAIAAMLVALVPTWFLLRTVPSRGWFMALAAVVLLAVGLNLGGLGGPSLARMTSVGASLPVATGAQLLTASSVENTLCLQECSQVTHLYAVLDSDTARSQVGGELTARGWEAFGGGTYCLEQFGVHLSATADPTIADPPPAPPGMELLSVSTSRCERG